MKHALAIAVMLLNSAFALAQEKTGPDLRAVYGKPVTVTRGVALTRSARHQGLKLSFQEGKIQPNWAQLSTEKQKLTYGPLKVSAAPRLMFNHDGQTGFGADLSLCILGAVDISHSAQFGSISQQTTTARLAPERFLSLKMTRSVSAHQQPITRLGPELSLFQKTNLSFEHAFDGNPHQVFLTSNIQF